MQHLAYLIWTADPDMFTIPLSLVGLPDRPVRWYGLLFAMGFILSQQLFYYIFRVEGKPQKDVDTITTYMIVAVLVGARLGHCLFYNPGYYLSNPIEILKIWEGGLASHGGAIGMLTALWLYINYEIKTRWFIVIPIAFSAKRQKRPGQSLYWIFDRMVIATALTGALIRIGNFMNSEMEGKETGSNLGVVYARATVDLLNYSDKVDNVSVIRDGAFTDVVPGRAPVKVLIQYRRGVEPEKSETTFIQTRLTNALRSYPEISQHLDFGTGPLDYEIVNNDDISTVVIRAQGIVRHAAQLYESGYCIALLLLLFFLWKYRRTVLPEGFLFALFMMLLWSLRFVDEFFKMNQEAFEDDLPLNMGQWLSIPMFLLGVFVMISIYRKQKTERIA